MAKYKFINDLLLDEEKCINYLQEMALKGWKLARIGSTFFKFKSIVPCELKYQIDYNKMSDDYLKVMEMEGYELIDNYREIKIFCNRNVFANDLHTDPKTRLLALKKLYRTSSILLLIFCAFVLNAISNPLGMYELLVRKTVGSYFIYLNFVLYHYLMKFVALGVFMEALIQLLIKLNLNRQLYDKKDLNNLIKYVLMFYKGFILFVLVFAGLLIVNIGMSKPIVLLAMIISLIIFSIYIYYVNKKAYQETNPVKRKLKMIMAVIVFFGVSLAFDQIKFNDKPTLAKSKFQNERYVQVEENNGLLVDLVSIYGTTSKEDGETTFVELFYTCFNDYVANEIFEEWICQNEQVTRIPSDEEIDKIVEKTGHWSTSDVEYLSYNQAVKKYTKIESNDIDLGYYLGNTYVMVKDNQVLRVIVKDEVNINEMIKYYFK